MLWAVLVLVVAVIGGLVVLGAFAWKLFQSVKSLGQKLAAASVQLAEISEAIAAMQINPDTSSRTNNR